ncbi:unnamed protein product [Darwinula stevensoni]|uniref:YEATS domain-containing protein 4 n=1 Tax=Darwinula stevensoni TaxID=69355 RepID=A0A7R8XGG8_9CRUS|nr:unnamed protein product [Darwinula stevensoni]CAG0891474.1 unnamed protein product [Darwinula stevensoni]
MAEAVGEASPVDRLKDGMNPFQGVTIVKPIVYGNSARYFGKKRDEDGHTHTWTVYVKPYNNEDMSVWVKKVHFKLHESYTNQNRVVTKPPYEVTETGWGEFEIIIKIYFHEPCNEKPVTLFHILKLFQTGSENNPGKKTLVSEFYDEIIFVDPSPLMQQLLTSTRQLTLGPYKHETDFEENEKKTLMAIRGGKEKICHEIEEQREKLKLAKETIGKFKEEINKVQFDIT